jgi:DNA-binding NtrC family response regulator
MPGFAAPEQRWGPKAPISRDNISTDPEISAAVDKLVGMSLAEVERVVIEATIQACGDSLPKAARVLGVSPSTLYRKRAGWSDQSGGS